MVKAGVEQGPDRVGAILEQMGWNPKTHTSFAENRCENCGVRPKLTDGEGLCLWCKRCVEVWYRQRKLTPARLEKIIREQAGELYLDACMADLEGGLAEQLQKKELWRDVYLHGPVGAGKTYAMAAYLRYLLSRGYECRRINFQDFCVQMRSCFAPASTQTEYAMIEPIKKVDVLFVDDLGLQSEEVTEFSYATLFTILNKRQEKMLPTIFSSNKSVRELARTFDSRIESRLFSALTILMSGKDWRRKKRRRDKE